MIGGAECLQTKSQFFLWSSLLPQLTFFIISRSVNIFPMLLEMVLLLGLELTAIDTATLDRFSCYPFPLLPPHFFHIHIPDSMRACLVLIEVVLVLGLELAAIDTATLCGLSC